MAAAPRNNPVWPGISRNAPRLTPVASPREITVVDHDVIKTWHSDARNGSKGSSSISSKARPQTNKGYSRHPK
jgi:hypothetical protein